jgi:hypothetical protein
LSALSFSTPGQISELASESHASKDFIEFSTKLDHAYLYIKIIPLVLDNQSAQISKEPRPTWRLGLNDFNSYFVVPTGFG